MHYACSQGIPLSIYLGRVVAEGEPRWLPEDRDVVTVWQEFERSRHEVCGRWSWEWDNYEQSVLDYDVCPFCVELEVVDQEKRENRKSMTGVSYYYRPLNPTDPDDRRRLMLNGH